MAETLSRRRRKEIASLTQKKYRERLGQMLVEGTRSVGSAVAAGAPLLEILVGESAREDPEVRRLAERGGLPIYVVPDDELASLSAVETSQGVLAVAEIRMAPVESLTAYRRIVALDGLQDPGNAGTIIRTAAWFGVDALLTASGTVDIYNPKVVRATMGALWDVRHVHVDDLTQALTRMHAEEFEIFGADMNGTSVRAWIPSEKSILVFGSEAHGLTPEVGSLVRERITIPGAASRRGTESLNVGAAAAILLYEWTA